MTSNRLPFLMATLLAMIFLISYSSGLGRAQVVAKCDTPTCIQIPYLQGPQVGQNQYCMFVSAGQLGLQTWAYDQPVAVTGIGKVSTKGTLGPRMGTKRIAVTGTRDCPGTVTPCSGMTTAWITAATPATVSTTCINAGGS